MVVVHSEAGLPLTVKTVLVVNQVDFVYARPHPELPIELCAKKLHRWCWSGQTHDLLRIACILSDHAEVSSKVSQLFPRASGISASFVCVRMSSSLVQRGRIDGIGGRQVQVVLLQNRQQSISRQVGVCVATDELVFDQIGMQSVGVDQVLDRRVSLCRSRFPGCRGRISDWTGTQDLRRLGQIDDAIEPVPAAAFLRPEAGQQPGLAAVVGAANRATKQNESAVVVPSAEQLPGMPGEA